MECNPPDMYYYAALLEPGGYSNDATTRAPFSAPSGPELLPDNHAWCPLQRLTHSLYSVGKSAIQTTRHARGSTKSLAPRICVPYLWNP